MRTTETSLRRTTERSLGVSFETNVRRRGDVLMGRRHYISLRRCHEIPISYREDVRLRRLGDIPLRRCGVFHLRRTFDVTETYRETFVRRRRDVLLPGGSYKAFLKNKKGLELFPLPHFLHRFWREFFCYPVIFPSFIVWWLLLREILRYMYVEIFVSKVTWWILKSILLF